MSFQLLDCYSCNQTVAVGIIYHCLPQANTLFARIVLHKYKQRCQKIRFKAPLPVTEPFMNKDYLKEHKVPKEITKSKHRVSPKKDCIIMRTGEKQTGQTFGAGGEWELRVNCTSHILTAVERISFACCWQESWNIASLALSHGSASSPPEFLQT